MTPSLTIDRWHLDCAVGSDTPEPDRAVAGLREAVLRDAAGRLAAQCARVLPGEGPALVFIDQLACGADVAAHWDRDELAQTLAAALVRAVAGRMRAPGPGIRIFADRADLVASYLLDRAAGTASQRWWYREFAGLAPLPASGAVRTLLTGEHALGLAALARLTRRGAPARPGRDDARRRRARACRLVGHGPGRRRGDAARGRAGDRRQRRPPRRSAPPTRSTSTSRRMRSNPAPQDRCCSRRSMRSRRFAPRRRAGAGWRT